MRKILLMLVVAAYSLSIAATSFSQSTQGFSGSVKSPEQLVNWLHSEFTYELKFPDYKQTPDETLKRRAGDCDDFARLSQMILNDMGIKSEVVIVKYRQIKIMHAICAFKSGATYSFISNREMIRTDGRSINEAITEVFPDWDSLTLLTADGQSGRTVERGYTGPIGASTLSVPSMYGSLLGPESRDIGMIKFTLESQLNYLTKSRMLFSASTLMTIFKDMAQSNIRFLFNKMQLTPGGFHVVCLVEDENGTRIYHVLFSIRAQQGGFTAAVYPAADWKRASQFDDIIPHPLMGAPSDIKFKLTNEENRISL